ncbi:ABC transporter ATP-binding protein [Nakamurella deserti]|uniref:ABC transporter ATP-binding protein n=1 Tax=Nakamurella deserti TaxID=2164074 RepID=UPI000DBEA1FA|nr:ABC transporter ATP-binding protein [Nakamurella deserti]
MSTPFGAVPQTVAAAAVEVSGVTKTFGKGRNQVVALTDIDLTIPAGEFISLIGPSGCGKSTLLRIIADLLPATTGTVRVSGETAREARLGRKYGFAFQQAGLLDWRTVLANVELPLELHGVGSRERRARGLELLEMVGLADFAKHRPPQLSGGMQQRVAIARALAERPGLLLMDEPFGALDEMTRERMQDELVRIAAETSAAVVFVTHSIPEAVFLSDRVVVMSPRPGRIATVVPVGLRQHADGSMASGTQVRESPAFFTAITQVREALRGREMSDGAHPGAAGAL